MRNNLCSLRVCAYVLARIQVVICGRVYPLAATIPPSDGLSLLSVLALAGKLSSKEDSNNCLFLKKKKRCHLLCCCPVLLRWIPVTENSQMLLVVKGTMKKDRSQCFCAMPKLFDSSCTRWWDRIEPWPTASYIRSHIQPYALQSYSRSCWTVSERLWTLLTVFWTPNIYAKLLTTHSPWKGCSHSFVYSPLSCCWSIYPHHLQSLVERTVLCSGTAVNLKVVADTATPWTAQLSESEHISPSNLIHVKLRGHSFYYHRLTPSSFPMVSDILKICSYTTCTPFYFNNKTSMT